MHPPWVKFTWISIFVSMWVRLLAEFNIHHIHWYKRNDKSDKVNQMTCGAPSPNGRGVLGRYAVLALWQWERPGLHWGPTRAPIPPQDLTGLPWHQRPRRHSFLPQARSLHLLLQRTHGELVMELISFHFRTSVVFIQFETMVLLKLLFCFIAP